MTDVQAQRIGRTARIPVSYPVIFQTDWYMDEGEMLDLSLPGCAIESSRCLIHDEYVRLHVLLPHNVVRVEVAKVRWTDRNRFGLEFLKLAEADKNRLLGLVTDLDMSVNPVAVVESAIPNQVSLPENGATRLPPSEQGGLRWQDVNV